MLPAQYPRAPRKAPKVHRDRRASHLTYSDYSMISIICQEYFDIFIKNPAFLFELFGKKGYYRNNGYFSHSAATSARTISACAS